MTQISNGNQAYNIQGGIPMNYYTPNSAVAYNNGQQGTVSVSTPNGFSQVYQYPTSSIYDTTSKQAASGVNIHIYNPSAIGGPSSNSMANATYALPDASVPMGQPMPAASLAPNQSSAIANSSINSKEGDSEKKTKKVVELTDDYIKTLESYLRSADKEVRKSAIVDLIKRFEEDSSRYDDPALTALLNIALQDTNANNRLLAMTPVAGENAHGDANTITLLKALQTSDKLYGQEAKMANEALLKAAQMKTEVPA